MNYFVVIKMQMLDILWCVCKQTSSEECIKVVFLMKLECRMGLHCIRNISLDNNSKGYVCATILEKVAIYPTVQRSAD